MKQPKALRLAEILESPDIDCSIEAAAELRRLHEVNQMLLEAVKSMKAEAETAGAGGDEIMLQDACEEISRCGFDAIQKAGEA